MAPGAIEEKFNPLTIQKWNYLQVQGKNKSKTNKTNTKCIHTHTHKQEK